MAKKSKPVKRAPRKAKKAAPKNKKLTKKAVVRSTSPKKKKAAVKKAAPKKKAVAKKAAVKPASRKGKKAAAKPASRRGKKLPAKKVVQAKPVAKPAAPVAKKKAELVKMPVPEPISLPPIEESLEDLAGKAANINTRPDQVMVPGDGLNDAPLITEDPVKTVDQNVFNKATTNGIPHSNPRFNSKPKNAVKPSGKKPLW